MAYKDSHSRGCCCCLLSTILKLIFTVAVVIGVAVLILWLVFRPHRLNFHVTDATLTEFNFDKNQLHYNLALNISIRNPNRRIGIYYDVVETAIVYRDQRLETQWLEPFYHGHKTTVVINPKFDGQQLVLLDDDEEENDESEVYDIDVKMFLRLRLQFGSVRVGKMKPKVNCQLKLPLKTSNGNSPAFQITPCDFDF